MKETIILTLLFGILIFLTNDGHAWVGRTIREAVCTIAKAFAYATETWQQRMMDNFLRRPKCHPDCFGAASNDCGRCSG